MMWTPTRLSIGEGPCDAEQRVDALCVGPPGYWERHDEKASCETWEIRFGGGTQLQRGVRLRPMRKSERSVVPVKRSNVRGGKGSHFGCASKAAEDRRLA